MKKRFFNKIFIALPVLREFENLEKILNLIFSQSFQDVELVVCINQPDSWWTDATKIKDCLDNQKSLDLCHSFKNFPLTIIDRSSPGKGWSEKKKGVGQARKTLFDFIVSKARDNDLVISLDADTCFSENYFQSLINRFNEFPNSPGMAVPYYHPLEDDEKVNRAILRYEIYMRYYLINLLRIGSPYAFTALGSGMAFPVWACKKVNGITPFEAGEDFYFLQKLCKTGKLLLWNQEKIYPSARISDRVPFGTGPSVRKGIDNQWENYPIYNHILFNMIEKTYHLFPTLFTQNIETPLTGFLIQQLKTPYLWEPLRNNFKTEQLFIRACHERLDGFRIFQFLKQQKETQKSDEEHLRNFFSDFFHNTNHVPDLTSFSFQNSPIKEFELIRFFLENEEMNLRSKHDNNLSVF